MSLVTLKPDATASNRLRMNPPPPPFPAVAIESPQVEQAREQRELEDSARGRTSKAAA